MVYSGPKLDTRVSRSRIAAHGALAKRHYSIQSVWDAIQSQLKLFLEKYLGNVTHKLKKFSFWCV